MTAPALGIMPYSDVLSKGQPRMHQIARCCAAGQFLTTVLYGEEEQKRDEQREDAQSFCNSETEHQTAKLAVSGGWVAQSAGEIACEDIAKAESRTGHTETGETGADELCCFRFHVKLLLD